MREWTLGVSDSRAAWIEGWLSKALEERSVDARELREALGRKVFMYGALVYGRPALAPLFAVLALHPPGVTIRLPLHALVVLRWLVDRIWARRSYPLKQRTAVKKAVLRVDAKAEGLSVAVGGWAPSTTRAGGSTSVAHVGFQ